MSEGKSRPVELKRALREARIALADRNDVVVDLREAEQARLELLSEALERVYADLPPDHDQLLLGLLPGEPPRFWVDATSFVMMGRDKRRYQFVKDTRLGRTIIAESTSVDAMAEAVTRYVAERIVEREHAIESDWLTQAIRAPNRSRVRPKPSGADNYAVIWGLSGFGLGMIAGMFLLLAYAWFASV